MNAKPETVLGSCSYYANDVYYTWQPNLSGYVVTEPPKEISEEEQPLIADELLSIPRRARVNSSKRMIVIAVINGASARLVMIRPSLKKTLQ